jgi:beta-galactosidase/beta-glucuronidase
MLCVALLVAVAPSRAASTIPLPEHPRPDFERRQWLNLNGEWEFKFDAQNAGLGAGWFRGETAFPLRITVPFGWGSRLSGVGNEADIAWYRRTVRIPESWRGQRVFLVVGASDWLTQGWLDGRPLGEHQGGYTPFEFELTPKVAWGREQSLVLRVDDAPRPFKLEGKQGYGNVRGLWQTAYLEARPPVHVRSLHFTPNVGAGNVTVQLRLSDPPPAGTKLRLIFKNGGVAETTHVVDAMGTAFDVAVAHAHLWSLEDPFLYEVEAVLQAGGGEDRISSYFGMREIGVAMLPGTSTPYVALNGRPIYLQLTLDQSYHPDGFYTFPTDDFMRDEILRSKQLGLNGNRVHIKVEVPRKLYWADRLGLLIMADVPNSWGEPDAPARQESEAALRGMIERDFNHPAIFSWVTFNETWGLFTGRNEAKKYLPETQQWVASMYRLAKQLDPTRLVEDNSPCNHDHVETDLNSWHDYLPGYAWRQHLDEISAKTHPGSAWNFIGGRVQANQPMFNSECGNVWGYEGSTGDVDWSWDYHIMLNEFRIRRWRVGSIPSTTT